MLADLVPALLADLAKGLNRTAIDLLGQPHMGPIGRPDFSVKDGTLLLGHVETKPPGAGADVRRFRGHDREQWKRFAQLPNLLYTDGVEFGLYRSGDRVGKVVSLDAGQSGVGVDSDQVRALVEMMAEFLSWRAVAPRDLAALAAQLAPLCALLRGAVRDQLARPESEVAKAAAEVRKALFGDSSPDEVADAFAQVCAYSMLLARSRGAERLGPREVESTLGHAHPVLGRVVRLLVDESTEAELGWALDTVRALVEAVDFPALEAREGADAWLYFYETFLAQYDPRLRDQYGVYYTPPAVISAQVAMLDELVRDRFKRPDGLASEGVTVLDPAVGTGSYPLGLIEAAVRRTRETRGAGAVPGVVAGLARNLFAFEILVGPYAVAHLRLNELIASEQGVPPADGPGVYLTDTLESPYAEPLDFGRQLAPLVAERRNAVRVKGEQGILVCLGNPPYERLSAEDEAGAAKGGWVVHGEGGGAGPPAIFSTFLDPARKNTIFSHIASLYNLYVFFWRWALWKVFEAPNVDGASNGQPGVVSFISASSYLTGPGFLGMREHLRRLCDEVWILDLGGEGHGARREENVFAIQTPVAICLAVRGGTGDSTTPATVRYARFRGSRPEKLAQLKGVEGLGNLEWTVAPDGWHDPFVPVGRVDWLEFPALIDLFPFQTPGTKVGRTWPVAVTADNAERRWAELSAAPSDEKSRYFFDPRFGRQAGDRLRPGARPVPASTERVADLESSSRSTTVTRYAYRSFDRQWLLADARVINLPRPPLWWAHSENQLYMTSLLTGLLGRGPAVTLAAEIPDLHHFRGSFGGRDVVPLYRDPAGTPNITPCVLKRLGDIFRGPVAAEDLFAYVYALLSARAYVDRFWDELEVPGPRIPIARDFACFSEVVELGRELINLHSFGTRILEYGRGVNPASARILEPIGPEMPEEFVYDEANRSLRVGRGRVEPVPPGVWAFEVSGLRVLRSWLRYRLREPVGRAGSSNSPLDHLRPERWTQALDQELLELAWVLERTLVLEERQRTLLEEVCSGPTVKARELPAPTEGDREPPPIPAEP